MTNKKQAFSVRLNRDAYNMLMRQPQSMRIELGDASSFMFIDDRPFDLNLRREQSTIQVYEKNQQTRQVDDYRIQYVGDITHVGHMKQVLSEEDKKRARSRTEQVEKEKSARRTELLDVPSIPTPTKMHGNSTPTATLLPTKRNSLLSPSSAVATTKNTSLSPSSSKNISPVSFSGGLDGGRRLEGAALQSLRERLIHLLALDPRPTDQLTQMLKVASVDLLHLLKKVAVFTNSIWCLRPETFKEIRIWEWTRYDDKERATVCRKAEEAYDFLKLARNAPERANLLQRKSRKPSPKLIPPPSQHTPTMGSSSHKMGGSNTPLSETATNNSNRKHGRLGMEERDSTNNSKPSTTKKRKIETATTKQKAPESTHLLPPSIKQSAAISPAHLTPTKKLNNGTKNQKTPTVHQSMAKESNTLHELSSTDVDDDDNEHHHYEGDDRRRRTGGKTYTYVAPTIQTQMDFDMLCKEHYDTQQDYIQFKKTFVQKHPIYIQALTAVNEQQDKELFARKLKAYYKSKGGDMDKWRQLMHLSRRFNGTHAKINLMWDTIEKAYRQKRFTLRLNRLASSSSSSVSSASSSLSPLSSSSPLPPPPAPTTTTASIKRSSHRA